MIGYVIASVVVIISLIILCAVIWDIFKEMNDKDSKGGMP